MCVVCVNEGQLCRFLQTELQNKQKQVQSAGRDLGGHRAERTQNTVLLNCPIVSQLEPSVLKKRPIVNETRPNGPLQSIKKLLGPVGLFTGPNGKPPSSGVVTKKKDDGAEVEEEVQINICKNGLGNKEPFSSRVIPHMRVLV